jgi:hypothetical protein
MQLSQSHYMGHIIIIKSNYFLLLNCFGDHCTMCKLYKYKLSLNIILKLYFIQSILYRETISLLPHEIL